MATRDKKFELLSAYLDAEVTEAQRAEAEALLSHDADARALFDGLKRVRAMVAALPASKAPDDFTGAVMARIERESLLEGPQRSPIRKVGNLFAMAASILLLVVAGWWVWPQPVAMERVALNSTGQHDIDDMPGLSQDNVHPFAAPASPAPRGRVAPPPASARPTRESAPGDRSVTAAKRGRSDETRVGKPADSMASGPGNQIVLGVTRQRDVPVLGMALADMARVADVDYEPVSRGSSESAPTDFVLRVPRSRLSQMIKDMQQSTAENEIAAVWIVNGDPFSNSESPETLVSRLAPGQLQALKHDEDAEGAAGHDRAPRVQAPPPSVNQDAAAQRADEPGHARTTSQRADSGSARPDAIRATPTVAEGDEIVSVRITIQRRSPALTPPAVAAPQVTSRPTTTRPSDGGGGNG